MSKVSKSVKNLSASQRMLLALKEARAQLSALKEPVAIIGMSCRFPGADDPAAYWRLLCNGEDLVGEIPAGRWDVEAYYDSNPDAVGKMYTRAGGFLRYNIAEFDPQFFGISPRETLSMDPQQRLLLEVGWEALENAGQAPANLHGSQTGVFIGITANDYARVLTRNDDMTQIGPHYMLGTSPSAASGRLSYVLGLLGPSLSIDSACSSSLVAVHLACQSLRLEECKMALVGGVHLILSPENSIAASRTRMMAPDGRCKTFDASADGFVPGEGCGVIVLKRLKDAEAEGDRILAVIRGSAVNQDGASGGFMVPNGQSQQALLRQALANAKIKPADVGYVEAHGSGTQLGDPIEVRALGAVLGEERTTPLMIGAVKTNIGHLESAAGIAGLIKVVLSLKHAEIPPHLHFFEPTPHIPWHELPVMVPTERTPWPLTYAERIAGVSSFGANGGNAHILLEAAPEKPSGSIPQPNDERSLHLLTLSAKSKEALVSLAKRYAEHIKQESLDIADVCFTANTGRSHFQHRLSVIGTTCEALSEKLARFSRQSSEDEDLSDGYDTSLLYRGASTSKQPKVAFLFTGQGSQYVGMGQRLFETQPTFRRILQDCDGYLRGYLNRPLLEVLYPAAGQSSPIDQTAYTQVALFALEYALAQLWKSWGVSPFAVIGHSVGEIVAACVAGLFSLDDALKLVVSRGRLMQSTQPGQMVAVAASSEQVSRAIYGTSVAIAAINGPQSVVISGETGAIQRVVTRLTEQSIQCKKLNVSHAFHSPLMEPILNDFLVTARQIEYREPKIGLISNVTGRLARFSEIGNPDYWARHIRQPVRFYDGIRSLRKHGARLFVEIGPKPILSAMGRRCFEESDADAVTWLPSLRPGRDWQELLTTVGQLYVRGVNVDWQGFEGSDASQSHKKVALPTYPFQRAPYWMPPNKTTHSNRAQRQGHPLLGQRLRSALSEIQFESLVSQSEPAFLSTHRVLEKVVFPASACIEMALAAGTELFKSNKVLLEDLFIQQALILPATGFQTLQFILSPVEEAYEFKLFSQPDTLAWRDDIPEADPPDWTLHATGKVRPALGSPPSRSDELKTWTWESATLSDSAKEAAAPTIEKVWQNDEVIRAQIQVPEQVLLSDYQIHPLLLNTCLEVLTLTFEGEHYLPLALERLQIYGQPGTNIWVEGRVELASRLLTADLDLFAPDGRLIASLSGIQFKQIDPSSQFGQRKQGWQDLLLEVEWQAKVRFGQLHPQGMISQLPTPSEIQAARATRQAELLSQPHLKVYAEAIEQLEELCVAYIIDAFAQLGSPLRQGQRFTQAQLAHELGVRDQYDRLLARLLQMLCTASILRVQGHQYEVIQAPYLAATRQRLEQAFLAQYALAAGELTMLSRCGSHLGQVLRGESDAVELLFPEGDFTMASQLYEKSPASQTLNLLAKEALQACLSQLPAGRGLRILEIGAGTGGTTSYLLPLLDQERTEYLFTDIGALFLMKAQEKFAEYPFLQVKRLDIELDPISQGFSEHQYDLIVAANVLHATKDLRETLQHVRRLLAPGGILVLLEVTSRQGWTDLTFGLTEGWWRFSDVDLRPDHALLSASQWQGLLEQVGFQDVVDTASPLTMADQNQPDLKIMSLLAQAGAVVEANEKGKHWLILAPREAADNNILRQELLPKLTAKGDSCTIVLPADSYRQLTAQEFEVNPLHRDEFERLLMAVPHIDGIIHGWGLDTIETIETVETEALKDSATLDLEAISELAVGSALYLVQAATNLSLTPRLWLLTRGSQPVTDTNLMFQHIAQSTLWGLGKTIALEHPELQSTLVDLEPLGTDNDPDVHALSQAQLLFEELSDPGGENQIAFRMGQQYVPRLKRGVLQGDIELSSQPLDLRADGTYLITGGLGGLGLAVARFLVEHGARHLVLVGRSGADSSAREVLKSFEKAGARVVVAQADVSQKEQIAQVLREIKIKEPPLRGIIHAAGIFEDRLLQEHQWDLFAKVFAPKVTGSWNLHTLTQDMPLDFFVLFSSAASMVGVAGVGNYVAANSFLDALAHYRRLKGLVGLSINWGFWKGLGMAVAVEKERQGYWAASGVLQMEQSQALAALEQLLMSENSQMGVFAIEPSKLLARYSQAGRKFFENFNSNLAQEQGQDQEAKFLQKLAATPESGRLHLLRAQVQAQLVELLGLDPAKPYDYEQGFFELGMDSLLSLEFRNRLQSTLQCNLPTTLTFKYPNLGLLVNYLADEVLEVFAPTGQKATAELPEAVQKSERQAEILPEGDLAEDQPELSYTRKLAKLESLLKEL